MYFNESDINSILVCKYCNAKLDEARNLPCGSVICNSCTKLLNIQKNNFKCIICTEEHLIKTDTLPINQLIQALLSNQPINVSRGESFEKLKHKVKIIQDSSKEIINCIENSSDYVKEYYTNLENEIQLVKEEHIKKVEDYHEKLSNDIKEIREEYLKKNSIMSYDSSRFKEILSELKTFKEISTGYLETNQVDDNLLNEMNTNGDKLIEKTKKQKRHLDCLTFDDKRLVFSKKSKLNLENIIGKLENISIISYILTPIQYDDLFELCSLNTNENWNLIYRATRDGFSAKAFHLKCNKRKNTLIIIKSTSGNIFGGYTELDWSGDYEFKKDTKSYLFSLINKDNMPILLPIRSNQSNWSSIYYKSNKCAYFDIDLCIASNSNIKKKSFSNLGSSYKHPIYYYGSKEAQTFLAGSKKFLTTEIEVFSTGDLIEDNESDKDQDSSSEESSEESSNDDSDQDSNTDSD